MAIGASAGDIFTWNVIDTRILRQETVPTHPQKQYNDSGTQTWGYFFFCAYAF